VPGEPDALEEVLRYAETEVAADGSFTLNNLAPGSYWMVAREVSEQQQNDPELKPLAWDAGGRLGLKYEGEATKNAVELISCQRVTDFALKYIPLVKPAKMSPKKPTQ
jgi:hypothetical protein